MKHLKKHCCQAFIGKPLVFCAAILVGMFVSEMLHHQCVYLLRWSSRREKAAKSHLVNRSNTHLVTLVTAYFPLENSKHSQDEYMSWISNFLTRIEETPLVIYTSNDSVPKLHAMRKQCASAGPTLYLEYESVWDLPWLLRQVPIVNASAAQNRTDWRNWKQAYEHQHSLDREKHIHSPHHYAIWNSKSWMLYAASAHNPFKSKFFLWIDIGSFRNPNHRFRRWPHLPAVEGIFHGHTDRMLLGVMEKVPQEKVGNYLESDGPLDKNILEGGFIAGTQASVSWWYNEFTRLHDKFYQLGKFVGKDQTIMNALLLLNPRRIIAVQSYDLPAKICDDEWYYFVHILAANNESWPGCPKNPLVFFTQYSS